MIKTIQLRENVKNQLGRLKTNKETYDGLILNLIKISEQCKRKQKVLLIEECKEMAKYNLIITKEWESTDDKLDWE